MSSVENRTHDPVDRLAEDFLERYRHGERPSVTEYAKQFPDVADQVADLIQVLLWMEKLREEQDHPPRDVQDSIPDQLGEYRIVREIGRGGMGVVYEAVQGELGRQVALKVLPSTALLKPIQLQRFRREAQAVARLRHPNIVPIYGEGTQDGIYYYAMQHIPGQGLDAVIKDVRRQRERSDAPETLKDAAVSPRSTLSCCKNPQDYSRAIARLGLEIAEALAHAHAHGILHRDIKPSNILLDKDGKAWLSDFGLAQDDAGESLTGTGDVVGTLRYMAPERFKGHSDSRSDLYSLGLTLHELLTLEPVFKAADRAKLVHQILSEEPALASASHAGIPRDLETIVLKAISKEPAHRYESADAFAEDLRRFLNDRPVTARRLHWWQRAGRWVRRNAAVSTATALAFAALLGGLAATYWQWQRAEEEASAKKRVAEVALEARAQADANAALAWRSLREILDSINKASSETLADVRRRLFQRAIGLHEEYLATVNDPPRRLEMASIAIELGQLHMNAGDTKRARMVLSKAIAALESIPQPHDIEILVQLGLAEAYLARSFESDDPNSSLTHAQKSIDILRSAKRADPENRRARIRLVYALDTHSLAQRRLSLEWEADLREAVSLIEQIDPETMPGNSETGAVVRCLRNYAISLMQSRREEEALPLAERAYRLAAQLARRLPDLDTTQELLSTCCSTYASLLSKKNDLERSEQLFRRNIEVYRSLLSGEPRNAHLHSNLGGDLNNLAIVLGKKQRLKEAHELIKEAIAEQKNAYQQFPGHKQYNEFLYNHYKTQTRLLLQDHDHVQAAPAARQLATLLRPGGLNQFEAAFYLCQAADQATEDQKLSPHEREQEAKKCCDQAMNHLRTAVQRGYSSKKILQDPPFQILKNRDDYRKLLAQVPDAAARSN